MSSGVQRLAGVPRRMAALLASGAERLQHLIELTRQSRAAGEEAARRAAAIEKDVSGISTDLRSVHAELRTLKRELHERLLQYHLQLGRLSRQMTSSPDPRQRLSGRTIPLQLDEVPAPEWESVGGAPAPDPEGREWLTLDACPLCGHPERTVVNPFNKLVLLKKAPDPSSVRYDYAVCHACGVLYASRRPTGARYRYLLDNFGEVTAKRGGDREITSPLLNPYPLSEDERERLRQRAARGVFVSDHLELPTREYLEALQKDRFDNSVHIDLLGTLVEPRGARVLELRPRTGAISDALRRYFGAQVFALPIWESQQFLLREVYGLDSPSLIDFDRFEIPFAGSFDLVVANHLLTHIIRPADFFRVIASRIPPGGYLYLYNEPDDAEFLSGQQSMIATLNPLHLQAFDRRSLRRALAANGFDVVFQRCRRNNLMCLARRADTEWKRMTRRERERRIHAYQLARDRAILAAAKDVRARFGDEWTQAIERGVAEGVVEFDADGHLRLVAN